MESGYLKINVASVNDQRAAIYFKYSEEAVSILKSAVPYSGRSFCRENRTWSVDIRSLPALIRTFEKYSIGGMFYECSALINAYQKYCGRVGIVDGTVRDKRNDPSQPVLFPDGEQKEKVSAPEEILPPGYGEITAGKSRLRYPEGSLFRPYPHQVSGADILIEGGRYILADTMGLGKTFTAIMAAYSCGGRTLVVTPASLKLNWRKEIHRFGIPEDDISVISSKTAAEDLKKDTGWTVVNYDSLRNVSRCVNLSSWASGFTTVIFDEAHYCKTVDTRGQPGSRRGRLSLEIAGRVKNVYLLTGTPVTNKTKDIFMLLKMIGSPLADSWFAFAHRYCGAQMTPFGWQFDGSSNRRDLNRKLRSCLLRRRTENVLDMPQKVRSFIPVEADLKEYDRLLRGYLTARDDDETGCALASLGAMKQAAARGKAEKTCSLIDDLLENGKSVVVYSCYLDVVSRICERFGDQCVRITGDVSAADRQKAVEQFQNGEKRVIVCTIGAGGVGLTLTRSDVVVFNDFDYSAANMRQAEDRIWRIGQRNACSIFYIYADKCSLDETLCNMLNRKLSNMGEIIDGREETLVTGEDESNQAELLRKLMSMKNTAGKKRRGRPRKKNETDLKKP